MMQLSHLFSIYINLVILGIGLYMAFVQSSNLIQIEHMNKEGQFSKVIGYIYIVIALIGFVVAAF